MDVERLADYLAGELSAGERTAVEAELARDPAAREQLAHLRTADEALGRLAPAEPTAGFRERLHAALAPETARAVGGSGDAPSAEEGVEEHAGDHQPPGDEHAAGDEHAPGDELAARRAARRKRTLPAALGGVAATLVLVVGAGVALQGLGGGEDADEMATDAEQSEGMDAAGGGAADGEAPEGPLLLATDRDLDQQDLRGILEEPTLDRLARRDLDGEAGRDLAARYEQRLADDRAMRQHGAEALEAWHARWDRFAGEHEALTPQARDEGTEQLSGSAGEADAAESDGATRNDQADREDTAGEDAESGDRTGGEAAAGSDAPPMPARPGHEVSLPDAEGRADARRCLEAVLADGPAAVPAYLELADYEGEPAVVIGLLTPGPDERYDRLEVWVLDREDCQVRDLRQRDR